MKLKNIILAAAACMSLSLAQAQQTFPTETFKTKSGKDVVITLITAPFVRRAPGVSFDAYAAGAEGSSVSSYLITSGWAAGLLQGLIGGAVIAGGVLLISLIMDKALKKESMGGGDIKLLFSAGFVLGPAGGLLCLILSCIAGLLVVVVKHSEKIPFGPSIAVSLSLSLLFGQEICSWHLHLLGL